jgi:hypothetical protein
MPVCRPLSSVLTWDARPDGSDEEAGQRGITLDATVTGVGCDRRPRHAAEGPDRSLRGPACG